MKLPLMRSHGFSKWDSDTFLDMARNQISGVYTLEALPDSTQARGNRPEKGRWRFSLGEMGLGSWCSVGKKPSDWWIPLRGPPGSFPHSLRAKENSLQLPKGHVENGSGVPRSGQKSTGARWGRAIPAHFNPESGSDVHLGCIARGIEQVVQGLSPSGRSQNWVALVLSPQDKPSHPHILRPRSHCRYEVTVENSLVAICCRSLKGSKVPTSVCSLPDGPGFKPTFVSAPELVFIRHAAVHDRAAPVAVHMGRLTLARPPAPHIRLPQTKIA